jgi:TonB family protein
MFVESRASLLAFPDTRRTPGGWALLASFALHLCFLLLVATLRMPTTLEKPLSSYQVSLVTLPASPRAAPASQPNPAMPEPASEQVAPAPSPPEPAATTAPTPLSPPIAVAKVEKPPAPVAKPSATARPTAKPSAPKADPFPAGPPPSEQRDSGRQSERLMRDLLRGIELPPDAPKLGDLASSPSIAPTRPAETNRANRSAQKLSKDGEMQTIVNRLNVPNVPDPAPSRKISVPVPEHQPREVLSEGLKKQLERLQQPIEPAQRPALSQTVEPTSQPSVVAKIPAVQNQRLVTAIQVPGLSSNPYLARVQSKISGKWIAPPVELTGRSLQVVIKFRLNRSGNVSDVVIERPSGNDYYDLAAKRAVLLADPLPPFPPDLKEEELDTHFSFIVGEPTG